MNRIWVTTLVLAGCAPARHYSVTGRELHQHIRELRGLGHARVEIEVEHGDRPVKHRHEVVQLNQGIEVDGGSRTIASLLASCPDAVPPASEPVPDHDVCALVLRRDDRFLLRSDPGAFSPRRLATITVGSIFVVGLVGGTVCAFGCDSPYNRIAIGTAVVSAIGVLAMCASTPGCHD
jgi:hypothetical protein